MRRFLVVFCVLSIVVSCNKDKPIKGDLTVSGYLTNDSNPVANAVVDINDLMQFRVNSKYYFQVERLIQNNGSPFPIYVPSEERVNLNIKNYLDRPGPYGIKISHLSVENGTAMEIGTATNILMNLGEVRLLYVDVLGGKDYEIVVGNNVDGGAYDNGAVTHISILEEG